MPNAEWDSAHEVEMVNRAFSSEATGVQFGVQIERNCRTLRNRNTCKSRTRRLSKRPSFGLGAGRSQVQILSPRWSKSPGNAGLLCAALSAIGLNARR
jgi:hypothetical protein